MASSDDSNKLQLNKNIVPATTIARSFSAQLNDIFLLDDNLEKLDKNVEEKKFQVSQQSAELDALEARLKRAEEMLAERSKKKTGAGEAGPSGHSSVRSSRRRNPLPDFSPTEEENKTLSSAPVDGEPAPDDGGGGGGDTIASAPQPPKKDNPVALPPRALPELGEKSEANDDEIVMTEKNEKTIRMRDEKQLPIQKDTYDTPYSTVAQKEIIRKPVPVSNYSDNAHHKPVPAPSYQNDAEIHKPTPVSMNNAEHKPLPPPNNGDGIHRKPAPVYSTADDDDVAPPAPARPVQQYSSLIPKSDPSGSLRPPGQDALATGMQTWSEHSSSLGSTSTVNSLSVKLDQLHPLNAQTPHVSANSNMHAKLETFTHLSKDLGKDLGERGRGGLLKMKKSFTGLRKKAQHDAPPTPPFSEEASSPGGRSVSLDRSRERRREDDDLPPLPPLPTPTQVEQHTSPTTQQAAKETQLPNLPESTRRERMEDAARKLEMTQKKAAEAYELTQKKASEAFSKFSGKVKGLRKRDTAPAPTPEEPPLAEWEIAERQKRLNEQPKQPPAPVSTNYAPISTSASLSPSTMKPLPALTTLSLQKPPTLSGHSAEGARTPPEKTPPAITTSIKTPLSQHEMTSPTATKGISSQVNTLLSKIATQTADSHAPPPPEKDGLSLLAPIVEPKGTSFMGDYSFEDDSKNTLALPSHNRDASNTSSEHGGAETYSFLGDYYFDGGGDNEKSRDSTAGSGMERIMAKLSNGASKASPTLSQDSPTLSQGEATPVPIQGQHATQIKFPTKREEQERQSVPVRFPPRQESSSSPPRGSAAPTLPEKDLSVSKALPMIDTKTSAPRFSANTPRSSSLSGASPFTPTTPRHSGTQRTSSLTSAPQPALSSPVDEPTPPLPMKDIPEEGPAPAQRLQPIRVSSNAYPVRPGYNSGAESSSVRSSSDLGAHSTSTDRTSVSSNNTQPIPTPTNRVRSSGSDTMRATNERQMFNGERRMPGPNDYRGRPPPRGGMHNPSNRSPALSPVTATNRPYANGSPGPSNRPHMHSESPGPNGRPFVGPPMRPNSRSNSPAPAPNNRARMRSESPGPNGRLFVRPPVRRNSRSNSPAPAPNGRPFVGSSMRSSSPGPQRPYMQGPPRSGSPGPNRPYAGPPRSSSPGPGGYPPRSASPAMSEQSRMRGPPPLHMRRPPPPPQVFDPLEYSADFYESPYPPRSRSDSMTGSPVPGSGSRSNSMGTTSRPPPPRIMRGNHHRPPYNGGSYRSDYDRSSSHGGGGVNVLDVGLGLNDLPTGEKRYRTQAQNIRGRGGPGNPERGMMGGEGSRMSRVEGMT